MDPSPTAAETMAPVPYQSPSVSDVMLNQPLHPPPPPYFSIFQPLESARPLSQSSQPQYPLPGQALQTPFIIPIHSSPRPSAPPAELPPNYSFRTQHLAGDSREATEGERFRLVLHAYSLLLVLFLLTLTLVATSKVLPVYLISPVYAISWIYYISMATVAASLLLLASWELSGQHSAVNDFLLLLLWGSATVGLIQNAQLSSTLSISLAGCLTLLTFLLFTLSAVQTEFDLTKYSSTIISFLLVVTSCTLFVAMVEKEHVGRAAIAGAWIVVSLLLLPLFSQIMVGGKNLEMPTDDFVLAVAILFTLVTSLFQNSLFFLESKF